MSMPENSLDVMERGIHNCDEPQPWTPHSSPAIVRIENRLSNEKVEIESENEQPKNLLRKWTQNMLSRLQKMWSDPTIIQDDSIIFRSVDEYPAGYPRLAAVVNSDENFMLYRRFGVLQARILLNKQDHLRDMEERLEAMDDHDDERDCRALESREYDDAKYKSRKKLLHNIELAFEEYARLLKSAQLMLSFQKAPPRDYTSMKNYFNGVAPLVKSERYIDHKEDLITLRSSRDRAWLDWFVDKILIKLSKHRCGGFVLDVFGSPKRKSKSGPGGLIVLLQRKRMAKFVYLVRSFVLTITILALLIVPVYWLYKLSSRDDAGSEKVFSLILSVMILFTFAFSVVLSTFTRAKRHEVLAAAAAYCAVLVVFVGNVGQLGHMGKDASSNITQTS